MASGWRPDPLQGGGRYRYWDGATWTSRVSDSPTGPTAPGARTEQDGPPKVHIGLRIAAFVGMLVLSLFAIGIAVGAADNLSYPTCSAVRAGTATLGSSGNCFDGSSFQKYAGSIIEFAAVALAALALVASFNLLITGRRGRLFVQLLVASLVVAGIGIAIIHL